MAKKLTPVEMIKRIRDKSRYGVLGRTQDSMDYASLDDIIVRLSGQNEQYWENLYDQRKKIFQHILDELRRGGKGGFTSWV